MQPIIKRAASWRQYLVEKDSDREKRNSESLLILRLRAVWIVKQDFTGYLEANAPDIQVVDIQNYSGDQQKAADVMQNMLLKHDQL